MIGGFITKLFGSRNQRVLKRMQRTVNQINALESQVQSLSDDQLKAKTNELRAALQQGKTVDDILPEAFAVVREVSKRNLDMRHFDVQLTGGMSLHHGKIAEQHTGEGKTLVATLAAYLNALSGKGVHVVTVNDYLARRDAQWMGPIYEFLGLSVGVVVANMTTTDKRAAYAADITYGTNNEFGFDYLRDNMAFSQDDQVQRPLHYAIVDEVDSILIDEARTPLIISGPAEDSSELYKRINAVVPRLKKQEDENAPGDFTVDEKSKQVYLTEAGHENVENIFVQDGLLSETDSLYAAGNVILMHHLLAALRAHHLFHCDVDYIVRQDEVIIVDEHTGRTMPGRRWSEGLHQAVEAKENVSIKNENQTLASITFQNYFRLYDKLSGMTGTADTEAYEFHQIYGLEVLVLPTNKPNIRVDYPDLVFLTKEEKFGALIKDIKECQSRLQPVLVGTASIETSEYLSDLLQKENIKHNVLNAKYHEQEAHIIAEAGRPGKITIATNMAGRGTDIVLGGSLNAELSALENPSAEQIAQLKTDWQQRHEAVVAAGGLRVVGSERHESRRIDNQLRGRCSRQGDPGSTRFYLSLDDNLMRIFAPPKLKNIMMKLGMGQGEAIESRLVTRSIENAQRKVEGHNFDIRKNLLQFDDVANEQRKVIYEQRRELMSSDDLSENVKVLREDVISSVINKFIPPNSVEELWDVPGLEKQLEQDFNLPLPIQKWLDTDDQLYDESLRHKILEEFERAYQEKENMITSNVVRQFEKAVMLQQLDLQWKDHLAAMDYLRQGINLRGYAARDPRQEYKREAFKLFEMMLDRVKYDIISILSRFQVRAEEDVEALEAQRRQSNHVNVEFKHAELDALSGHEENEQRDEKVVSISSRQSQKPGRNDPCYCGSGKKYKLCHGQIE